ncbi:MAG: hypothetical protein QN152_05435 [Armatimonadota bacterium]|nr:hypothetical protein [Armatimonadota bacterium]MDR7465453.1 hypothetical protein [Armatimonadota bacterium]MDR7469249.1 hypothetical protein [Armatimonadota bacterium]MDR7475040.1 hypothetical protein [Armatimonadota bacterium]MDR7538962.1 hypothetical protein [Armatimonadota bacterium]
MADPALYVLVTIPRSLEPSVRGALGGLHLPFFVEWTQNGIVLVARAQEWQRVAARFPGAVTEEGYRLVSLGVASGVGGPDSGHAAAAADLAALANLLQQRGVAVRPLRSFYRDHLLVPAEQLAACLEVLGALPGPR